MNLRLSFLFTVTVLLCFFASVELAAQTKQRVGFKKKGFARVTGTIRGDEIREYVFRVKKDADVDISVDNDYYAKVQKPHPKFLVFKPDGKPLNDDQEPAADLLDVFPQAGDYTIRLQLPEDMRKNGAKPVKFTFQILIR